MVAPPGRCRVLDLRRRDILNEIAYSTRTSAILVLAPEWYVLWRADAMARPPPLDNAVLSPQNDFFARIGHAWVRVQGMARPLVSNAKANAHIPSHVDERLYKRKRNNAKTGLVHCNISRAAAHVHDMTNCDCSAQDSTKLGQPVGRRPFQRTTPSVTSRSCGGQSRSVQASMCQCARLGKVERLTCPVPTTRAFPKSSQCRGR